MSSEQAQAARWPRVALKELVDERGISYGVVQPGQPQAQGVPLVRVNNFTSHGLEMSDVMRIDPQIAERYGRSRLRGGEVLVTLVGSVGNVAVVPPELVGGNIARAVGVIPVKRGVSAHWVAWCLKASEAQRHFEVHVNTTVQKTLNLRDLASLEIPLPPREEIQAVSEVLGGLDAKIASNRRLASRLEETVALLFWKRFVGFVGVASLQGSELGPIPHGWRIGELGDLALLAKRNVQPAEFPDQRFEHFSIPAFDGDNGPEAVAGSAMLSGKTLLPNGDVILLSKLNPTTRRIWWPRPSGLGTPICSPEFLALAPREGIPVTYLHGVLAGDRRFYDELLGHATGTTGSRQRVKPRDALSCRVLLPPNETLTAWDQTARPMHDQAAVLRAETRTLAALRGSLLPRLISGEIRVPATDDPRGALESITAAA